MTSGYRDSHGVDFDEVFEPGAADDEPASPGFRGLDGTPLRFAAVARGRQGPDVGCRDRLGVDLATYWAVRGST